jgi:cytochrome b involved in lipid metabolism
MDVTNWLDEHPGGPQALFSHMGKDASEGELANASYVGGF